MARGWGLRGRMQPRKLQCCICRDTIKPRLRFSWFCVFFVSKGNLFLLLFYSTVAGVMPCGGRKRLPVHHHTQRAHDVNITSPQRRCNVMTLHRRWGDVIFTSCAYRDSAGYILFPLESLSLSFFFFFFFFFENRIQLKPAVGGICRFTNYSVAYVKTQSNRVSDFHDFVCSFFLKAILFDFYFHKPLIRVLMPLSFISPFVV